MWLCDVVAVRAGDRSLICHIGDDDSVQDVRFHPSNIQGVGRAPGEEDGASATFNHHITHWHSCQLSRKRPGHPGIFAFVPVPHGRLFVSIVVPESRASGKY